MKLGLQINNFAWSGGPERMGAALADIARTADEAGFAVIGVADHLWQGPYLGGPLAPELESGIALGVVAANTRRAKLTHMVAGVHFRPPALLAKAVTTLDVVSGGRAWLGIGAGWCTRKKRSGWASPSRRWPNASRCWRKRCKFAYGSGAANMATSGRSSASITGWNGR